MKKIMVLISGVLLLTNTAAKKSYNYFTYYGTNMYMSETGSGYGLTANVNFYAQEFNRIFELGLMLNANDLNISGFEFIYKHFLGFRSAHFYDKSLKPFFYYNLLYRMPAKIITTSTLKSATVETSESNGKILTLEHYVGLGVQLKLIKKFYFEGITGFGAYLGSRYQGSKPKTWGIHQKNHGFVPSVKLGFGFQF